MSAHNLLEAPPGRHSSEIGLRKSRERYTNHRLIDLFCGAGGMTLGFSQAFGRPFQSVWANDMDADAAATYNHNFGPHCVVGDIVSLLEDPSVHIPRADVVIGGPPCQGFSLLNKGRADDARKQMWRPFLEVVRRSEASVFVIENVPQILGSPEHAEITEAAEEMGYHLTYGKLCAADYGVPQVRWRAFIIGCKNADPRLVFPPTRTPLPPKKAGQGVQFNGEMLWQTVRDAIGDLPPPEGTTIRDVPPPLDLHFGRAPTELSITRYKAIPNEGMNRFDLQRAVPELTPACWIRKTSGGTDLFGRLWWDRPAFTIRTEFYKPEKGRYLHPEQHRPITHREAARFQSFPDDFTFVGSKVEIARQIGNAVPPLLASAVADCVTVLLKARGAVAHTFSEQDQRASPNVMIDPLFKVARKRFHAALLNPMLQSKNAGLPSNADKDNRLSVHFAQGILTLLGSETTENEFSGQNSGKHFETCIRGFLSETFLQLPHFQPGTWDIQYVGGSNSLAIAHFEQYAHLNALQKAAKKDQALAALLRSDFTIMPNIIISREMECDSLLGDTPDVISDTVAKQSSRRKSYGPSSVLHASICCKWTLRSDPTQNSRSEALNLMRNRKGCLPLSVIVTGEPLPSRIASLALGTGDIDCVYHFALDELFQTVSNSPYDDAKELLEIMIEGKRLKDVSSLPLDLAI